MNTILKLAVLALALGATVSAQASPKIAYSPSVPVVDGPFGGTLLASMTSELIGGQLRSAVYDNGAQGTNIYYQLVNNPGSAGVIGSIEQYGIGGDFFGKEVFWIGAWTAQTNAAFGMFSAGTAKAGVTWSYLYGQCVDSNCQTQLSSFSTRTEFVGDGWLPESEVLTGIAPGTASYTGRVLAGSSRSPDYALGTLYVDGQPVSAFVTTVPEPETYAMFFAGFALVGAIARRRKNKRVCVS